jgi:hypothetical protein
MTKRLRLSRLFVAVAAVAALGALGASTASAHSSTSSCPTYPLVQPFAPAPWSDTNSYFLAPAGSFENTLSGWTATGGAKIVKGNETYYVNSKSDNHSLSLPTGSTATSPSICVSADTPALRLFVLNTGNANATLNVNMTYTNKKGKPNTVTVATLTGGSTWSLSAPVLFLANIQPIVDGNNCTYVTFAFAPVGSKGTWQVDDFYVDPVKHH